MMSILKSDPNTVGITGVDNAGGEKAYCASAAFISVAKRASSLSRVSEAP